MTETSRYLTILAKVMRTKDLPEDRKNKDKYNKLYSLVETELNNKLKKSQYPQTSDIIQQTKEMLETIETLYLFPEIVGKRCVFQIISRQTFLIYVNICLKTMIYPQL